MKKLFFSLMAAAALFTVASCSEDEALKSNAGNESLVSINISTPEIATRTFGDGTTAQRLQYAVYNQKGELLENLTVTDGTIQMKTTVDLKLVTGNTYYLVFWASEENAPYTVDFAANYEDASMTVNDNYKGYANDEKRDAFFNVDTIYVNGPKSVDVKLYRPFAQVNIGTEDKQAASDAGFTVNQSTIATTAYSKLNFSSKEASEEVPVEYTLTNIPDATVETFPVDGYNYLAMNYLLMQSDRETVEIDFTYTSVEGQTKSRSFGQVPVQRNWRTNIYGQLLTNDIEVNVEIVPAFDDDIDVEDVADGVYINAEGEYVITSENGLYWLADMVNNGVSATTRAESNDFAGKTFVLATDLDLEGAEWTPIGNGKTKFMGTFDGQGFTVSNYKITEQSEYLGLFGCTKGTIKNLNVENVTIVGNHYAGAIVGHGLCARIEGCTVKNAEITLNVENSDNGDKAGAIVGYLSGEPTAYVKGCAVENVTITAYRDLGALVGIANGTAEVSGNSVKNANIISKGQNYKNYTEDAEFDANEVVGETSAKATVKDNTVENVTVVVVREDVVSAQTDLAEAVKVEGAVVNLAAGEYALPKTFAAGVTLVCEEGVVFKGNTKFSINGATIVGATFDNNGAAVLNSGAINAIFKNCTFNGDLKYGYATDCVVFENCVFGGNDYQLHFDGASSGYAETAKVVVKNCVVKGGGRIAIAGGVKFFEVENTKFEDTSFINVYNNASFTGCEFDTKPRPLGGRQTYTNCQYASAPLTVEGIQFYKGYPSTINIDGVNYAAAFTAEELTNAIANATEDLTVVLKSTITADATAVQKAGVNIVIDGNNQYFTKTLYLEGQARHTGAETLTIKNIQFSNFNSDNRDFISANSTESAKRYAHNVTVENCTFKADPSYTGAVAMRYRQCYNMVVRNCEFKDMHSAMWATGCSSITVEGCEVNNCKNGFSFGTSANVAVENTKMNVESYGIRIDGNATSTLNVANSGITANQPIVARKVTGSATINLGANVALAAGAEDGYQVIFTNGDDAEAYTEPTGSYAINGGDIFKVYPRN